MLLMGFGNKARHGKDSAASAVSQYFIRRNTARALMGVSFPPIKTGIFKFATALYDEVESYIGLYDGNLSEAFKGSVVLPDESRIQIPSWVTPGDPRPAPMAKYGKHPKLLQWWGTEYRRQHYGHDYWVKKTFASIPANLDIAMVTDVRFINEADAIKQRGGYNINVQRLREDGQPYFSDDRPADHPSETALDDYNWDFYIKTRNNQVVAGEFAVTIAEYLRGLKK